MSVWSRRSAYRGKEGCTIIESCTYQEVQWSRRSSLDNRTLRQCCLFWDGGWEINESQWGEGNGEMNVLGFASFTCVLRVKVASEEGGNLVTSSGNVCLRNPPTSILFLIQHLFLFIWAWCNGYSLFFLTTGIWCCVCVFVFAVKYRKHAHAHIKKI